LAALALISWIPATDQNSKEPARVGERNGCLRGILVARIFVGESGGKTAALHMVHAQLLRGVRGCGSVQRDGGARDAPRNPLRLHPRPNLAG